MNTARMKTTELIFYLSYSIYMVSALLSNSLYFKYFIGRPYNLILGTAVLLLIIREIMVDRFTVRTLCYALLCLFLMALIVKNNNVISLALLFFYIFEARNVNVRQTLRLTFWISAAVLLFVIISSRAGLINDYLEFTSGRVRHYLGFTYSLYAPTLLFNIIAVWLWYRGRKITWAELLIAALLQYWVCNVTDSRLTLYCAYICLVMFALWKIWPRYLKKGKPLAWIMITSFLWSAVLSLLVTARYSTRVHWMTELNEQLGRRMELGNNSLKLYGVKLFGQKISWQGNGLDIYGKSSKLEYTYVDNLYQQFLQRYGLIFLIIVLALVTVLMYRVYRAEKYEVMIVLFTLALHGMIDDLIFYLYFNTFWLAVGMYVFRSRTGEKKAGSVSTEDAEPPRINGREIWTA